MNPSVVRSRPRLLRVIAAFVVATMIAEPVLYARTIARSSGKSSSSSSYKRKATSSSRSYKRPSSKSYKRPSSSSYKRPSSSSYKRPSSSPSRTRTPLTGSKSSSSRVTKSRPSVRPSIPTKPTSRPAIPSTKPGTRPAIPSTKPGTRPAIPSTKPGTRPAIPSTKPGTRPAIPSTKPGTRPAIPSTKPGTRPLPSDPGQVTFPKPEQRPSIRPPKPGARPAPAPGSRPGAKPGDRPSTLPAPPSSRPVIPPSRPAVKPGNRPGIRPPAFGNRPDRPGTGDRDDWWNQRPGRPNRPGRPGGDRPWNRPGGGINVGDININIDNNFKKSYNWSKNKKSWGGRPWWNYGYHGSWCRGRWNYGWGPRYNPRWHHHHHHYHGWGYYDDDDWAKAIGWGLIGWGLGNLFFNSGYGSYTNVYKTNTVVYQAAPVADPVYAVDYSQPMTVESEAAQQELDKLPEEKQAELAEKALAALDDGRAAFKTGDYLTATKKAEEAIAYDPGDPVSHEFRALCLFALGKYGDAAVVLSSLLSSGPGWGWDTMIALYDSPSTYTEQLRKAEAYAKGKPEAADIQFVLGYHYMVGGYLPEAATAFGNASRLQPADAVAKQLYELCLSSSNGEEPPEGEQPAAPAAEAPSKPESPEQAELPPAPTFSQLQGSWVANKGDKGTITLAIDTANKFTWTFQHGEKQNVMKGDVTIDQGLLVLATDETQMVGATTFSDGDKKMNFVLAGGPEGDPGLNFVKES